MKHHGAACRPLRGCAARGAPISGSSILNSRAIVALSFWTVSQAFGWYPGSQVYTRIFGSGISRQSVSWSGFILRVAVTVSHPCISGYGWCSLGAFGVGLVFFCWEVVFVFVVFGIRPVLVQLVS